MRFHARFNKVLTYFPNEKHFRIHFYVLFYIRRLKRILSYSGGHCHTARNITKDAASEELARTI